MGAGRGDLGSRRRPHIHPRATLPQAAYGAGVAEAAADREALKRALLKGEEGAKKLCKLSAAPVKKGVALAPSLTHNFAGPAAVGG